MFRCKNILILTAGFSDVAKFTIIVIVIVIVIVTVLMYTLIPIVGLKILLSPILH